MMRKIILLVFAFFLITNSFAQFTAETIDDTTNINSIMPSENQVFANKWYIFFKKTTAVGRFALPARSVTNLINNRGGMSSGFGGDFGRIIYLPFINSDHIGFGYEYAIEGSYVKAIHLGSISNNYTAFVAAKFGPVFSYTPADKFIIDLKFAIIPERVYYKNILELDNAEDKEMKLAGDYTRLAFGTNIRYRAFTLGVEYGWGDVELSYYKLSTEQNALGFNKLIRGKEVTELDTSRFDLIFGFSW